MDFQKLTEAEENLANYIWDQEPIKSKDIVDYCKKEFSWTKSTTYTLLRRIVEKGIFKNENSIVESILSKEDYQSENGSSFIEKQFGGSLPSFIAAFSKKNKLSKEDIKELEDLIENSKED